MTYTFGVEIETSGAMIATVQAALRDAGIQGCNVVPDGTPAVDAEIVLPPLADCQVAYEYIDSVCRVLQRIGCTVNQSCGLHVHISNAPLSDETTPAAFTGDSIAHKERTGRYLSRHGEPMDFIAVQDIMQRYADNRAIIDGMFPSSRTDNRFCKPLDTQRVRTAHDLRALTFGKFYAINLETWSRGTIEFRQHSGTIETDKIWNWVQFLINFVSWTTDHRVESGTRTIVQDTPAQPFRRASRVGVQYTMMRRDGGATTRDIMNATGCSEQRVRAAVSEIRARVGQSAVITHTQQANGAAYGDGTDLTRYEVLPSVETQTSGAQLMPENRIGIPSIWANLSDDLFEYWQERIDQLAR